MFDMFFHHAASTQKILAVDALTCAGAGLLMLFGRNQLEPLTGLPAELLAGAGAALLPVAALFFAMSRMRPLPPILLWIAVLGNAAKLQIVQAHRLSRGTTDSAVQTTPHHPSKEWWSDWAVRVPFAAPGRHNKIPATTPPGSTEVWPDIAGYSAAICAAPRWGAV